MGFKPHAYTQDVDDMIDAEMRRQKTDFVRTSMKKSIRTYTYKLLNKAEANIEAVGKRTFGVGIYPNKSKNPAAKKI
jgi:basic membrane lipoprotein Med (substrate-binding protein (PBP1-ABC) superfamily)